MTYSATVLADSPLLYCRLGDASGTTMTDASGNGFNGTYHNSPTVGSAGLLTGDADTAVVFNGTTQWAGVSSHTVGGGSTFTLEAWIKTSTASCQILAEGRNSTTNPLARMQITAAGKVVFTHRDDALTLVSLTGATTVNNNVIHHIVCVKNGSTYTIYVDGVSDATTTGTTSTATFDRTAVACYDGGGSQSQFLAGTVDEVATYTTALSSTRVSAHYTAGTSSTPTAQSLSVTQTQTPTLAATLTTPKALSVTQTQTPTLAAVGPTITNKTLSVTQSQTAAIDPLAGHKTTASGDEANPAVVVKTASMRGASPVTLPLMIPDSVTWTLDQPDAYETHFPKGAYASADVPVIGTAAGGARELQIYRNGDLLTVGPIITLNGAGSDGAVHCRGAGVDWYLFRRFLDGLIPNLLTNPDFEAGTTGWTANGGVTFTADTANFVTGTKSAKLVAATAGGDTQIHQTVTAGPNGVGVLLTASAWFFIEAFTAPAFASLGLYLSGGPSGGPPTTNNYYPIDNATPRGQWVKASTTLWIPPNEPWDVDLACYSPQGATRWDDVKLVAMDSVSTAGLTGSVNTPVDIADIIQLMVAHVQKTSAGKSGLNIGTHCEPTGVKLVKHWQYVDHVQFDQALKEFLDRGDGADYAIELTPTTRTFHSYANKRGTDRSGSVTLKRIAGDPTNNCTDYRYVADGTGCITRQTVIGTDNGPDREQGEAADATAVGGVILQDVRQAPQNTATSSLQPLADERIARFGDVPVTIELDVKGSSGLIPVLKEGDLVTVAATDGFVGASGVWRIMQRKLTFATNLLTVTCAQDTL